MSSSAAILSGVSSPVPVTNASGTTLVTNAGSNGKLLAVMDLDVNGGRIAGYRYRLLPIFSRLVPADRDMQQLIEPIRAPHQD